MTMKAVSTSGNSLARSGRLTGPTSGSTYSGSGANPCAAKLCE